MKPQLVSVVVNLQPRVATALQNLVTASGRERNDVLAAAVELGLARAMGEFNRHKREAAKVEAQARWARQLAAEERAEAARAEAHRKAALAKVNALVPAPATTAPAEGWWDDDGPTL